MNRTRPPRTRIPLVEHQNPTEAGTYTTDDTGKLTKVSDWVRVPEPKPESPPEVVPALDATAKRARKPAAEAPAE